MLTLFDIPKILPPVANMPFAGATFDPAHDQTRLGTQQEQVLSLMRDGRWRTLGEIGAVVKGSEAGLSARLRDLRKPKFGGFTVERRRRGEPGAGWFEYRVLPT